MPTLDETAARIAACEDCPLSRGRLKTVPGEGPESAKIMLIGEAPGHNENQQGRPFIGPAGKLLDDLLASIDLARADVFITNVVKCRPPANRDPQPEEISACAHYLDDQIEQIKPRVIVTLGRYSMARYFPGEAISRVHGTTRHFTSRGRQWTCFAMYHPAAALHNPQLKSTLISDMRKVPKIIEEIEEAARKAATPPKDPEPPASAEQLSLF